MKNIHGITVAVVGLGYVGLPLAIALSKKYRNVIGFDINKSRVAALRLNSDETNEVLAETLLSADNIKFTYDAEDLSCCDVYIVTVPTPIDEYRSPDLRALEAASETVASFMSEGDVVIYESTVYPGATEEVCVPILERTSGLVFNRDFFVGYSPERINPGDKTYTIEKITKVVAGSNAEASNFVAQLYSQVVDAGVHNVSSIKVAEAAKVIENTQRDLNIALMNELSIIFDKLELDTIEILEAAGTKWNFLPFRPGLVGGHCIGVDPYYLTHKAESIGYHPQVILAGRRINDGMGKYVVERLVKLLNKKKKALACVKVLIMGITFKENCPDLRNSRVFDIINELHNYEASIDVYDPIASDLVPQRSFSSIEFPELDTYDAIIIAVAHNIFIELGVEAIKRFGKSDSILFDVKSVFSKEAVNGRL